MKPLVLIVEDEPPQAELLKFNLERDGFRTALAGDGEEALLLAEEEAPDLVILDWMLPLLSGIEVCRRLRRQNTSAKLPIIMLTARGVESDRIRGLGSGADDYLIKPFAFSELKARANVLIRRPTAPEKTTVLETNSLKMDLMGRRVFREDKEISLKPREFRLLEFLLRHPGQVVTRTMLLEQVWDYHFDPQTNVIDVYISRLRVKLDKGFATPLLETVRGSGYRLLED